MEAAPRLPMISFDLKLSTEPVSFGSKLKQYISGFYHEDPENYNNEIHTLESLRSAAAHPPIDVSGCQTLKRYYCQLNFLKSRFPMAKGQPAAITFTWKDVYTGIVCSVSDIEFELMSILYNIGALHTQLGASDIRTTSEGMKMSCTHFQCAAWAFQHLKETYPQFVSLLLAIELVHFMYQVCLAQAQECILEKSMMDNRKATIIAKVAVQTVDYYNQALKTLSSGINDGNSNSADNNPMSDLIGGQMLKEWTRYLRFKVAYHSCVSLLYQGQQAEEQQKMGERVALYQAASDQLEEARRLAAKASSKHPGGAQTEDALAFTQDVVEGKKKAAKNENEFIYHEVVPERDAIQQINGASLVRAVPFSTDDQDVSGADIFGRLVPMEAHEASSIYSERKAEMLRQLGALVEARDHELAEFMSSLQLDCLRYVDNNSAVDISQDIVDRAAALSARPQAVQQLVDVMARLAGIYHDVEALLGEVQEMLNHEQNREREYKASGPAIARPPSMVLTDLSREASKYSEAHSKANESNQALHRAMSTHVANLRVLSQPLTEIERNIPRLRVPDPAIDEQVLMEIRQLVAKVDEMKQQRTQLVAGLREAVCTDDITSQLVTRPSNVSLDQLFERELAKHQRQAALIEQNLAAQENILKALTNSYARFTNTRKHIIEIVKRREVTITALITSYDAYDDLLSKANKGIEFYQKLETNVTKLLQRVKSACRVQEEEREQMLANVNSNSTCHQTTPVVNTAATTTGPKLKDYLRAQQGVRPTPVGSEETATKLLDQQPTLQHQQHYVHSAGAQSPYQPAPVGYPSLGGYSLTSSGQHPNYNMSAQQQPDLQPNSYYQYMGQQMPSTPTIQQPKKQQPTMPQMSTQSYPMMQNYPTSNQKQQYQVQQFQQQQQQPQQPQQQQPQQQQPQQQQQQLQQPSYQNYHTQGYQTTQNYELPSNYQTTHQNYQPVQNYQQHQPSPNAYQPQPQNMYQSQPQNYVNYASPSNYVPPQLPASQYQNTCNYATYTYPSYQQYASSYTANTQPASSSATNLDLLTGLDFSVSQVPLDPVKAPIQNIQSSMPSKIQSQSPPIQQKPVLPEELQPTPITLTVANSPQNFFQDVERLERFVLGMTNRTLNGPTPLDIKWKEIQIEQDRESDGLSISVARCYPMKNRFPDVLPYDHSRIELATSKDDYINASSVPAVSSRCPPLIVTQAPIPPAQDFWAMVRERQLELIVCLLGDNELAAEEGGGPYWPDGQPGTTYSVTTGIMLTLLARSVKQHWIERVIGLQTTEKHGHQQHVVVHLQLTSWPTVRGQFPNDPVPLVTLVIETLSQHEQQRVRTRPVLIHCLSGAGRSGLFALVLAAVAEMSSEPIALLDIQSAIVRMSHYRKNMLRDREHLLFAYKSILHHGRMVATTLSTTGQMQRLTIMTPDPVPSTSAPPIQPAPLDPLSSLDPLWINKKS